jgi:phenylpropionate dioxygenase-like ring-hydroxylating dioxygenase large terminal subunit
MNLPAADSVRRAATCTDRVALDEWYVISALDEIAIGTTYRTRLLGDAVAYARDADGAPAVWRGSNDVGPRLAHRVKFGYVWTTLGSPDHEIFDIAECDETDRRILNGGSILVATSAPRAVENFLDMGHFPYVHTGILGSEPRTEVVDYDVETTNDQVLATRCLFYQPQAAASSTGGQMSEYTYRVPHPYCVMLYKSNPDDPSRMDVIALFNQPMTEESIRAHNFLCLLDDVTPDAAIRRFQ